MVDERKTLVTSWWYVPKFEPKYTSSWFAVDLYYSVGSNFCLESRRPGLNPHLQSSFLVVHLRFQRVCVCFGFVLLFYRYYFFTFFSRYVILSRLCTSDEWSCSLSFKSSSICLLCWFIVFSNSSRVFAKLSPIKIQHHNLKGRTIVDVMGVVLVVPWWCWWCCGGGAGGYWEVKWKRSLGNEIKSF